MASFDLLAHSSAEQVSTVVSGTSYTTPVTLPVQSAALGVLLVVDTVSAGTVQVTLQTAATGAEASDSASWLNTPVTWSVSLAVADVTRKRVASYLLDKVRLKIVGTGAGELRHQFLSDGAL